MFRVIEGGLGGVSIVKGPADASDVRLEAARRLKAAGYDDALARSFQTGQPVPSGLRYLKVQTEYAAAALGKMSPVPADYRENKYWPLA